MGKSIRESDGNELVKSPMGNSLVDSIFYWRFDLDAIIHLDMVGFKRVPVSYLSSLLYFGVRPV